MKIGVIIVIAVVLILGAAIAYSLMSKTYSTNTNPNQVATGTDVKIKNFAFTPDSLTIKIGEIVTWTNEENAIHTITSDSGNELNSQDIANGEVYSHKFTSAGTYEYHCTYHNSMKGKIIVE